jgi:hypothetical protein
MKQRVIIYKILKYASPIKSHVWVDTNVGVIKKPISSVPSIAVESFLAREQETYWDRERQIQNCECKNPKEGKKRFVGEHEGNYTKCVNCGGKIWA